VAASVRSETAAWVPSASKTRPFRFGLASDPDPDPPLEPGAPVGDRYRVVRLLGEGGVGRVYEAEHAYIHRRVALKLLRRDQQASPEHVARFKQEAYAANKIEHRAIVQVLDFGQLPDGRAYLAMELLEGESLEEWMSRPGKLADAVPWLIEIARGLDAAQQAGVVHRDIKPANVFLQTKEGEISPRILDFGLAKVTTAEEVKIETKAGSVLGTPYYLAPERALGRTLDSRADLYSLGVILYELLTGNIPFAADTFMGVLGQHIKSVPLDPRQAAPDRGLPDSIALLTMRLLEKDPARRPQRGEELAVELERIAAQEHQILATIVTGSRGTPGALSEATIVLDDVSNRPTQAPTAPLSDMPAMPHGRATEADPGVRVASAPAVRTRFETRSEPWEAGGAPERRWPWLVGGVVVMAAAVAAIWLAVTGVRQPRHDAATGTQDAAAPAEAPGGEPAAPGATSQATVAGAPSIDDTGAPGQTVASGADAATEAAGEVVPKAEASGGTTAGSEPSRPRRRPERKRKPAKSKPEKPKVEDGVPKLKDDVYED
jgi:serine/threonine-protein kinase